MLRPLFDLKSTCEQRNNKREGLPKSVEGASCRITVGTSVELGIYFLLSICLAFEVHIKVEGGELEMIVSCLFFSLKILNFNHTAFGYI